MVRHWITLVICSLYLSFSGHFIKVNWSCVFQRSPFSMKNLIDCRLFVWKKHEVLDCTNNAVKHRGGNIQIWSCFSYSGVWELVSIDEGMDSKGILDADICKEISPTITIWSAPDTLLKRTLQSWNGLLKINSSWFGVLFPNTVSLVHFKCAPNLQILQEATEKILKLN